MKRGLILLLLLAVTLGVVSSQLSQAEAPSAKFDNVTLEGNLTGGGTGTISGFNIPLWYNDNTSVYDLLTQLLNQGEGGWITAGWDNSGTLNINNFPAQLRPIQVVSSLTGVVCGSAAYPEGSVVYLTTDYKLRRCRVDNTWTMAVDNTDLVGLITADIVNANTVISDNIITNNMIVGGISAAKLSVTNLAAINANMGALTAGTITSSNYAAPTGSVAGAGLKINASTGVIEAYGSSQTFMGSIVSSDGSYMVSIGAYLTEPTGLTAHYPPNNATYFTTDGTIHIYRWGGSSWTEIVTIGSHSSSMNLRAIADNTTEYATYVGGGTKSPLVIVPSASASAPTHTAYKGALWVTSDGVLYINTSGSTTWGKVGAQ